MNLNELFNIQAKLDERIVEEHGLRDDLLDKKILALQVELGELANEWRGFKFWSKDQEPRTYEKCHVCQGHGETVVPAFPDFEEMEQDMCPVCEGDGKSGKNPLLEEYVDCLHFILSIGLELGIKEYKALPHTEETITDQFIELNYQTYLVLQRNENNKGSHKGQWYLLMDIFIGLGKMLGFNWKQIEQAYMKKNQINHERQTEGY